MATLNFKGIMYIEDSAHVAITTGNSPIRFCDPEDPTVTYVDGTHLNNGVWQFNIPSGVLGWEVWVETSSGVYTRDAYLSGTISGNNLGALLAPIELIET